jgi:hypothetical protein
MPHEQVTKIVAEEIRSPVSGHLLELIHGQMLLTEVSQENACRLCVCELILDRSLAPVAPLAPVIVVPHIGSAKQFMASKILLFEYSILFIGFDVYEYHEYHDCFV